LDDIVQRNLTNNKLDCNHLSDILAKTFYELTAYGELPDEDVHIVLDAVKEWQLHLSGKGVGDRGPKQRCLDYMKATVSRLSGHPLDETNIYTMSSIMQPLLISPLINIPDVFAVAEKHLNLLPQEAVKDIISDDVVAEAFLKECLRVGHPFPIVERTVKGGCLGKYYMVGRYDVFGNDEPNFDLSRWRDPKDASKLSYSCPYEAMLFGSGPRRCQGSQLALRLMRLLLKHYAKDLDFFKPSEGHGVSGRTNDTECSIMQELHKVNVIFLVLWKTSWILAPVRFVRRSLGLKV